MQNNFGAFMAGPLLGFGLGILAGSAHAETAIDRICRNYTGIADCTDEAALCGEGNVEPGMEMPVDRECFAAGFLHCWPKGLRGKKLDACASDYDNKHNEL